MQTEYITKNSIWNEIAMRESAVLDKVYTSTQKLHLDDLTQLKHFVEDLPAADVREVTECKDCAYSYELNDRDLACSIHNGCLKQDHDFCSVGIDFSKIQIEDDAPGVFVPIGRVGQMARVGDVWYEIRQIKVTESNKAAGNKIEYALHTKDYWTPRHMIKEIRDKEKL